jgi:hypothetical protein
VPARCRREFNSNSVSGKAQSYANDGKPGGVSGQFMVLPYGFLNMSMQNIANEPREFLRRLISIGMSAILR